MLNILRMMKIKKHPQSEMSPFDSIALRTLLDRFNRSDLRILEIGSWFGAGSTAIFANYAQSIVCVDHWRGNMNKTHQHLASALDPFTIFKNNTASFKDKIIAVHTDSSNIKDLFAKNSFDLVFIDADHRYQQTKQDILNTLDLVKKGGVLCGHDCEGRPSTLNTDLLMANLEHDHMDSCFTRFKEMHPGVIIAVNELLPGANLFADHELSVQQDHKIVNGYSSIWWKEMI